MEEKSKKMTEFEFNRQIFHMLLGVVLVLLLKYGFVNKSIILALILAGFALSFLSAKIKIPVIYYILQKFERKKDLEKFPGKGIIFYFIGIYISLLLFPKEVAMASIMILALGDSVSHLYGLHYGRIKHPLSSTKFFEGTIAGFIAGFIGALIFLPWLEAFLASLAAMAVEAVEIKLGTEQVDDNLIIPVIAGAVVWVIRLF